MEDFYINSNSQGESYNYSNITYDYSNITSNYNYSNITSDYSNIMVNYYNFFDYGYFYYDYYGFSFFSFYYYGYDYNYYDYNYITSDHNNNTGKFDYYKNAHFIMDVVTCIIIAVGLPLTLLAIYALYSLVQNDHVAPIYVINLLISDLIQLCCLIAWVAPPDDRKIFVIFSYIYYTGLVVSVGFMVCVALERYLVIACPLWYRFRRTIKISVVVCVMVWFFPVVVVPIFYWVPNQVRYTVFSVFLLLPLPLLIFFLGGTLKALSGSRVPSDEKRRIVGVLALVLLIYMLLSLPAIILYLLKKGRNNITLLRVSLTILKLNPLADSALYVFMKKGTIDKLLASVCCCKMDSNDTVVSSV